jgi:hypothetical protein
MIDVNVNSSELVATQQKDLTAAEIPKCVGDNLSGKVVGTELFKWGVDDDGVDGWVMQGKGSKVSDLKADSFDATNNMISWLPEEGERVQLYIKGEMKATEFVAEGVFQEVDVVWTQKGENDVEEKYRRRFVVLGDDKKDQMEGETELPGWLKEE